MRVTPAVVATLSLVVPLSVSAQDAQPITQSIRSAWNGAKKNIQDSAELMPEANYDFKPVDGVRTFGQILAHVAGANYEICANAKGEKSPHAEDEFEKSATTRAAIVKALNESMAYCDAAFAAVDDKTLGAPIDMPFGMGKRARVDALILNIGHLNEHYGNLVTYFRIKGIVPPTSRR
jgi:uncharacterized damage-inducible protein DinB